MEIFHHKKIENTDDPTSMAEINSFYPRNFIATSSCVSAELCCSKCSVLIRDGFPTSLLDFSQEIECCGRSVDCSKNDKIPGLAQFILSMSSFVCLVDSVNAVEEEDSSLIGYKEK